MGEAMTDLEITKLCAEAMGYSLSWDHQGNARAYPLGQIYDPLHDDAQAMALKKKFRLSDRYFQDEGMWGVPIEGGGGWSMSLNRAICECVARMQQAKVAA